MGVEGSRGGGAMSQVLRDAAPVAPRLEPRGRPGGSKGVDPRPLGEATRSQGRAAGVWHAGAGHGRGRHGPTRAPAAQSWEEPERMARGDPVAA
jgi:hypothetical protein